MVTRWASNLFAVEDGSGPALLLLHGGLASHHAVLPILAPLADRYRVIAPDLRGSGRSRCSEDLTFDRLAEGLARLLDHLAIKRVVVGGISTGSGIAVRFALRYPERTRALIVMRPVYAGADIGYTTGQAAAFAAMDSVAGRATDGGVEVLEPLFERFPSGVGERAWRMVEESNGASVAATSRFIASGAQPFGSCGELESIAVPTLLVRGDDERHPAEDSDVYARCIGECTALPATTGDLESAIRGFCAVVLAGGPAVPPSRLRCPPQGHVAGGLAGANERDIGEIAGTGFGLELPDP